MTSAPSTTRPPKVLVNSALVGAGHVQAAKALLEGLRQADPRLAVEHIDSLQYAPRWFRAVYAGGFALLMSRFKWLHGLGYWFFNRPQRPGFTLQERLRLWNERRAMKRLAAMLEERAPELVVSTQYLAPPIIARMVRLGLLRTRQMMVVTDYEVHRWWYCPDVERWFVPAEVSARTLLRWGVPEDRITVSGIPVHPKWTVPLDRSKVFSDWKLPLDRPIVVLSGGTEFVAGPVVKIAAGILASCPRAHLVVLAGRNKKLLGELSCLPEAGGRLQPVAFTDRVHELVEVCSLMVTKPGGLSTTECLSKGAPMVLLKPVPGHEEGNARHFASHGAAVVARKTEDVIAQVSWLLEDREELARMADRARRLYRPATETIVQAILDRVRASGG
jgi:processive 1,2-diacylglycerol beta-glucosyltransferase